MSLDLLANANHYTKYQHVKSVLCFGSKDAISEPYITIAIPTYRRPVLLKEAIDSALTQDIGVFDYEVIVVDNDNEFDRETDTGKLIEEYSDDRLLYYKNERNLGMFGNINRCVELARGQWIAFLHDDDLLTPNYVGTVKELLRRKSDIGALITESETVGSSGLWTAKAHGNSLRDYFQATLRMKRSSKMTRMRPFDIALWPKNLYGPPTCGMLFYRQYLIDEGGFNEEYYPSSDWFFMYKFNANHKVYKTNEVLGYYRLLESESLNPKTLREFVRWSAEFRQYIRGHSILGRIMNTVFGYEQHVTTIEWVTTLDKASELRCDEFDYLCKYRVRPLMLYIYKKMSSVYWLTKGLCTLVFG